MTVLTINGTAGNDYISVNGSSGELMKIDVNGVITGYNEFDYSGVVLNGIGGNDIFNMIATDLPVTINGAGQDTVTVGDTDGVQDITSPVDITDPPGGDYATVTIDDSEDTVGRNATISDTSITNLAPATISYSPEDLASLTINGGSGGNNFTVASIPEGLGNTPTNLNSGTGSDTVNIQAVASDTTLTLQGQNGGDSVDVTDAGSVQDIAGTVNIQNQHPFDNLTIDDSADTTPRTAYFTTYIPGGDNTPWESVQGLAPGIIDYREEDISSATIDGGGGGNTFNVYGLAPGAFDDEPTNLNTGFGSNTVNIFDTSAGTVLNVQSQDNFDFVNVGNSSNVQGVQGTVNVDNAGWFDFLTVDDSADPTSRNAILDPVTVAGDPDWESLTGLAPGTINWELSETYTATINGGTAGNVFNVNGIGAGGDIDLSSGSGADQVNILASAAGTTLNLEGDGGSDIVDVSNAGSVQGIQGTVNIQNTPSFSTVTIDDGQDTSPRTATLSTVMMGGSIWGSVTGLAPGTINFKGADVALNPVTILGGSGGNTFNITGIVDTTDLYSGYGSDQVNIMATPANSTLNLQGQNGDDTVNVGNAGSVQGIHGVIYLRNDFGYDALTIDDSADPAAQNALLSSFVPFGDSVFESLTGLSPAGSAIDFRTADMSSVIIRAGNGANIFNIDALAAGGFDTYSLFTGAGNDTINIHATSAATVLSLTTLGGSDTVNLDFSSGNPLPSQFDLNGLFTITGFVAGENLNGTTVEFGRSTVYFNYGSPLADPIALIKSYLKTGYANGGWTGTATALTGAINCPQAGINPNHTTAIGYADAADGSGIDPLPNSILLKYTIYGDANLDGQTNSADLQRLLAFFNHPGSWDQGDFNYDGVVNSADQQLLLFTFNTGLGSQAVPVAQASSSTLPSTGAGSKGSKSPFNLTTYVATAAPVVPPPPHHRRGNHG